MKKKDIKRNRKNENLAGLYAVPYDFAIEKNGKPKKGVYGVLSLLHKKSSVIILSQRIFI